MKISDVRPAPAPAEIRPVKDKATGISPEEAPASSQVDRATIGSVASAASQALKDRDARVAELRAQYLAGTYKVDAKDISSKLIDEQLG